MATVNPTTQAQFVQTIIDNADDDAPRLVNADYLDEHGETERAEFVRVQCELARCPEEDPRYLDLRERERALLANNKEAWSAELKLPPSQLRYRRGFAEFARLTAATYLKRGRVLHRLAPFTHIALTHLGSRLRRLVEFPTLAMLNALDICNAGLGNDDAALLGTSPYLGRLRSFDLSCNRLRAAGVGAILTSVYLTALSSLNVTCNALDSTDAVALAPLPELARVTEWCLDGNDIGNAGLIALVRSPYFTPTKLFLDFNGIGDEGAQVLVTSTQMDNVTVLGLGSNDFGPVGVRAMIDSLHWGRLEYLDVSRNAFTDVDAVSWSSTASMPALKLMDVTGCRGLGPRGLAALIGWQPQTRIRHPYLPKIEIHHARSPYERAIEDMDRVVDHFYVGLTGAVAPSLSPEGVLDIVQSNDARKAGLRAMMPALYRSIAKAEVD